MTNTNFIPTTATTIQKIKKAAKVLSKTTDISHVMALEKISKEHGYNNWNHVNESFKLSNENKS